MSELQLRLDSVKQEAGANKLKLQVSAFSKIPTISAHVSVCVFVCLFVSVSVFLFTTPSTVSQHTNDSHVLTRLLQALVAEWEKVQAEGGDKSLSAGSYIENQPKTPAKTMQPANTFVTGSRCFILIPSFQPMRS